MVDTPMETYQMRIGAQWRGASGGRTRPVLNPATGEGFAEVSEGTREDAHAVLEAAAQAQPNWEALSGIQRASYLKRIAALIRDDAERLARLVVREQGKPLVEARGEIGGTSEFFEYFATFARGTLGEIIAAYGLTAYLFTQDIKRMMRAVQAVRFGELSINKIGPEQLQGFHAGYRLSGMGGDDGKHGFDHYFRKKTVYVNYADTPTSNLMPYPNLPPQ